MVQGGASLLRGAEVVQETLKKCGGYATKSGFYLFFQPFQKFSGHISENAAPLHHFLFNSLILLYIIVVQVVVQVWCKWVQVWCKSWWVFLTCTQIIMLEIKRLCQVVQGCRQKYCRLTISNRVCFSLSRSVPSVKSLLFRVITLSSDSSKTVYSINGQRAFCFLSLLAGCSYVGRVRRKGRNHFIAQNYIKCCKGVRTMADINDLRGVRTMKGAIRIEMDCVSGWIGKTGQAPPLERFPKSGENPHLLLVINWSTFLKRFLFDQLRTLQAQLRTLRTQLRHYGFRQSFLAAAGFPKVGGRGECVLSAVSGGVR